MKDFLERLKSYKTTIIGVFTAVISILVFFGILEPKNNGVEVVTTLWDGVLQVLAVIAGLLLIFSKDSEIE